MFSRLRRGDILGALADVEATPVGQRPVALALLGAEAAVCCGRGDLDELEHLHDVIRADGDTTLDLRMEATLADHHASRGNPLCGLIAAQAIAAVGEEPLRDSDALWARGRLWRTLALATLFVPDDRPARSFGLLERAKADLAHAGFHVEWARCAADLHFVWTLAFAEDVDRTSDTVDECLARLRQWGSAYVDLVLGYRAYLDLARGDLVAAEACADEIDRMAAARPVHALTPVIAGYVRSAGALVTHGPTPDVLAATEDHLRRVRAVATHVVAGQMVGLASILIDLGHVEPEHLAVARRWATQAGAGETSIPSTGHDLAALNGQLDLLEPTDADAADAAVAAMDDHLARGRRLGLRRDTARQALRAAVAARRADLDDVAERWFQDGLADLPPPPRRTFWERTVVTSAAAHRGQASPGITSRPLVLRVMAPTADARLDGRPVGLSSAQLKLLVGLAVEHPAPMHTEQASDLLWPDLPATTTRERLNALVYRLRNRLGRLGDLVWRDDDLLGIDPARCDVDLWRFRRSLVGEVAERRRALVEVRGLVCDAQFLYDERFADERRQLAGTWRRQAGALVRDGELGVDELGPALAALRLDKDDLGT